MTVYIRLDDGRTLDYYTFWDSVRECQDAFVNEEPAVAFTKVSCRINGKMPDTTCATFKEMDSVDVAYCLNQAFESASLHGYGLGARLLDEDDATLDKSKKQMIRDAALCHAVR
jgi:hypothetical protein